MNTRSQKLEDVAIADLRASKTNPRKTFAPGPLKELADSILTQGIRQPILARPKDGETPYEIVAGERRYRAAQLAGLATVPCLVQEMNDREALEVQVVENLQRSDLTEMEEAQSYQSMLELKEETTGAAVYTAELLAERFGKEKTHVYRRLVLLRLIDTGREALAAGQIGATAAVLVARIPSPEAQAEALKQILTPQHRQEPLTFVETRDLISRDFLQGLKGAPFKLDDAALVPAAGACATCPKMSDNCAHLFTAEEAEQVKKKKVCTDPTCYRLKLDALWAKRTAHAAAEGKTVLDEKESREIFPPHVEAGAMAYSSHYVFLGDKPAAYLLKPEVVENVGSWRSLIEEAEKKSAAIALAAAKDAVRQDDTLSAAAKKDALALIDKNPPGGSVLPRILARDQRGDARELVDRGLAMTLIEAAGDPIFMGKTSGHQGSVSQFDKERKAQVEAAKLRVAESIEALTRIHAELVAKWEPSGVYEGLFEIALGHAGFDGAWLVAKWQKLKFDPHGTTVYDAVGKWAAALLPAERQALVPLIMMAAHLKISGPGDELESFAHSAGIPCDLKDIARTAKQALKATKPDKKGTKGAQKAHAQAAPAAPAAPEPAVDIALEVVAELLGYDDAGKSLEEMAYLTHLSADTVRSVLRARGRDQLKCEKMTGEVDIDRAREVLLGALKEAIPGLTEQARAKILAKYAKRVGCEKTALEDLSYAEVMKIVDILATAKVGRGAGKAKVSTAGEQDGV
jgi:ParB/RepB/Spo0J family partition protein